ncbi:NagC family transcriptional regulator [Candidatus Bathyarchaeota archaeon]|nr:NagC family transcriptional regulator [Candidatus Bathyarchaeota archaeon]
MSKRFAGIKGLSGREALRLMQKMGVGVEELNNVEKVEIKMGPRKIIIENPKVAAIKLQGQIMYQITGGEIKEEEEKLEEQKETVLEEDVKLVAEQAGVSLEEARKALETSGGDLAQAILSLKEKK